MNDLAICAIFKNEAAYISEWLTYHYYIGIRKFILYNNNSNDNSVEVVREWPHADLVTIVDWPYRAGQATAYDNMLKEYRDVAKWCAFIDCDEFLCPTADLSVQEVLDGVGQHANGLYVFWYMFGSSGHTTRPEGLVTETYTMRAKDDFGSHYYGKSIIRLHKALSVGIHVAKCEGRLVNDDDEDMDQSSIGKQEQKSHRLVSLNHYFTKSLEEWRARRALGQASKTPDDPGFTRPESDFHLHDRNDVLDDRAAKIMRDAREEALTRDGKAYLEVRANIAGQGHVTELNSTDRAYQTATVVRYTDLLTAHNAENQARFANALTCLKILNDLFPLEGKEVVDFGCGIGGWLAAAQFLGPKSILGLEAEWIRSIKTIIPGECIEVVDFGLGTVDLKKRFDLAITIEVAEQLPIEAADSFCDSLVNASNLIVFSAAIPGQGGVNHVNEQPLSYWIEKFWQRQFVPLEVIRPTIAGDKTIYPWLRQNLIMFVKYDDLLQSKQWIDYARPRTHFSRIWNS